jgi:hypothetical protein
VGVDAGVLGGRRDAEESLEPDAEEARIDRDRHVAVGGDRVLHRRDRIAAVAEQL